MDEIERLLKDGSILDLDEERLRAELDEFFHHQEERDREISDTLEGLLSEVEELIDLAEELEPDGHDL